MAKGKSRLDHWPFVSTDRKLEASESRRAVKRASDYLLESLRRARDANPASLSNKGYATIAFDPDPLNFLRREKILKATIAKLANPFTIVSGTEEKFIVAKIRPKVSAAVGIDVLGYRGAILDIIREGQKNGDLPNTPDSAIRVLVPRSVLRASGAIAPVSPGRKEPKA